jgi:hypothetical protein
MRIPVMAFRATLRILLSSALVLATVPVIAGTADARALEARVDQLMWQLVNDERYAHLGVAANYDKVRALLEQACLASTEPCAALDRMTHSGRTMTTEITPEQTEALEQLLFTIHSASASVTEPAAYLMATAFEPR